MEDAGPLVARPGPLFSVGTLRESAARAHGRSLASFAGCGAPPPLHPPLFRRDNAALLALLCLYSLFGAALVSVASPFLPLQMLAIGARPALVGAVFAAYPLANLLLSPFCAAVCAKLGRRRVFVLGVLLEALSAAAMGMVAVSPSAGGAYLCLRALQGCGAALSYCALLAWCADRFRGGLATVVGLQEAVAGVGFMVGPPLGGWLYAAGGFRLPFIVMGAGLLVALPLLPLALPFSTEDAEAEETPALGVAPPHGASHLSDSQAAQPAFVQRPPVTFLAVARLPPVLNACCVTLLAGLGFGFIGPTLAPHLRSTLGASERAIGALFGLTALTYALAAPLAGVLSDAHGPVRILALGTALLAVSYLLLGPSPLFGSRAAHAAPAGAWTLQLLSLALLGFAAALAFIPCMPAMEAAATARFGDGPASGETVAALYNGVYCGGEALGPLLGSSLVGALGFRWASTLVGGVLIGYLAALGALAVHRKGLPRWRRTHAYREAWWTQRALAQQPLLDAAAEEENFVWD